MRAVADRAGGLDAVFTAAGADRCGTLAEVAARDWERVVLVNLVGTAAVVRAALPYLTASRRTVVTVRVDARVPGTVRTRPRTAQSKFGVVGFTRALAAELRGEVGVTMLVPGGMPTGPSSTTGTRSPSPPRSAKLNDPARVAEAVLFALRQPPGCEVASSSITPSVESSWP